MAVKYVSSRQTGNSPDTGVCHFVVREKTGFWETFTITSKTDISRTPNRMDNNSVLTRSKIRFAGISHVVFLVMAAGSGSGQVPLRRLVVPLRGPSGASVGTAVFRTTITGKLSIHIEVMNLSAGRHAVHIHENSVCDGAMDFLTAGDHFNPDERQHGYMNPMGHHAGDLPGNISVEVKHVRKTNQTTEGEAEFTVDDLSLTPGAANSVLGRSIIVHDGADDMRADPTGNSGNRVACGVIEALLVT